MQTFLGQLGVPNVPGSIPVVRGFEDGSNETYPTVYSISGTTRNSAGAALGGCNVKLFRTADDSLVNQALSDVNGYYITPASPLLTHYVVAYLPGSPDVAGTTVNTLIGA